MHEFTEKDLPNPGKPERSGKRDEKEYEIGLKSTLEQTIFAKKP